MPKLVNRYSDCRLFNLDPGDAPWGPFVIAQEGYDPLDEDQMIDTVFLLRRDGTWIDEISQTHLPEEQRFLVFFDSAEEAARMLESLSGDPVIERHPVSLGDLRERIAELKAGGYTVRGTVLVEHYRAWKRATRP